MVLVLHFLSFSALTYLVHTLFYEEIGEMVLVLIGKDESWQG